MDLVAISSSRGAFYAPAFSVLVSGKDLLRNHLIAVSQVEADLVLGAPGRFSFTIVDAYKVNKAKRGNKDEEQTFSFITGDGQNIFEILTFGAPVEIRMGYGTLTDQNIIMTGVITEISTNFPESGSPELSVAGYDRAFPLTLGKNSWPWTKVSDSDVVAKIASFHNLQGDIEPTREKHAQIEQNQQSDLEFIKKLAERNHDFIFYVWKNILRFGKPKNKGDGVVSLSWGEGLLSFKPEANLAGQVAKVEVYGWDPNTKKTIVGRAEAGAESGRDPRAKSGADLLKKPSYQQPVLRLRQTMFTQAEADNRARAALNERANQFLTGEAESIGLPEIRPDTNVTLKGLGSPFSKTYYVQQATHKMDSNGYRTRFKVKETTLETQS